jgi:hypothetical protein
VSVDTARRPIPAFKLIADDLQRRIKIGDLSALRLNADDLSVDYDASPIALREALYRLQNLGLVRRTAPLRFHGYAYVPFSRCEGGLMPSLETRLSQQMLPALRTFISEASARLTVVEAWKRGPDTDPLVFVRGRGPAGNGDAALYRLSPPARLLTWCRRLFESDSLLLGWTTHRRHPRLGNFAPYQGPSSSCSRQSTHVGGTPALVPVDTRSALGEALVGAAAALTLQGGGRPVVKASTSLCGGARVRVAAQRGVLRSGAARRAAVSRGPDDRSCPPRHVECRGRFRLCAAVRGDALAA